MKGIFYTMKLYDKHCFQNENLKKNLKFCDSIERLTKDFCHKESQKELAVTTQIPKLRNWILAMKVRFKFFKWSCLAKQ